jgi:hypothetical protein
MTLRHKREQHHENHAESPLKSAGHMKLNAGENLKR